MEFENQNSRKKHGTSIAARIPTWGMSTMERSPMSQKIILWSLASWVNETRNMMIAPQKAFTITPERRRASFFRIVCPEDMTRISKSVPILPEKAVRLTPGNRTSPIRMPIMAPMADPPEIPKI